MNRAQISMILFEKLPFLAFFEPEMRPKVGLGQPPDLQLAENCFFLPLKNKKIK